MKLYLIYKGKGDGFKWNDFNSRINEKGPTISVIKSEHGKTFGGFTDLKVVRSCNGIWNSGEGNSLIFQLDYNTKHKCIDKYTEVYGHSWQSI